MPSPTSPQRDPEKVADFILFSQREFLLNLSTDLNRGNVSFAQFYLLSYLGVSKALTMTDIAKKMGHSTAAATGLVDRLEKLGYVERAHDAQDRRKVMVSITREGTNLLTRLRSQLTNRVSDAMNEEPSSGHWDFLKRLGKEE